MPEQRIIHIAMLVAQAVTWLQASITGWQNTHNFGNQLSKWTRFVCWQPKAASGHCVWLYLTACMLYNVDSSDDAPCHYNLLNPGAFEPRRALNFID